MRSKTGNVTRLGFRAGCLVSVLGPLIAILIYPRMHWLFGCLLVGIVLLVIAIKTRREPTAGEVAERAERHVEGRTERWDVDDYEHLNPKDPQVRDLWHRTMAVGGLPEEWARLDEAKKNEVREIIRNLRRLGVNA